MKLLDRYFFAQLLWPTLWTLAALSGVGLLSQGLTGLDLIVEQRQSVWMFTKIILLGTPEMISLLVPLAVFVGALVTLNRLHGEQEIIVCYAGGRSRWKVASPAMRVAVWMTLATLVINLWIQPMASRRLRAELNAARADLAAALVREGQFTQPTPDLTVYAREVERGGLLRDLFINHASKNGDITYTAAEGQLVRRNGQPELIMLNGATQRYTDENGLTYVTFEHYPFDLAPFALANTQADTKAVDRYMSELWNPNADDEWGQAHRPLMRAEFHSRIAAPLYNLTFMSLALMAILGGVFSRLGYSRRITVISLGALAFRVLGFMAKEAAAEQPIFNIAQYLLPGLGMALVLAVFIVPGMRAPRLALRPA